MSHENSITIQDPRTGRWVNIPSVLEGKDLDEEEATKAFMKGQLQPLGEQDFLTVEDAVKAAKARSKSFDATPLDHEEQAKKLYPTMR